MIALKSIKPSALKESALRLELLNAMRKAGREITKDFESTTRTWEHKPRFETLLSLTGPGPVVLVATDDKIYGYVTRGTKPHLIWAGYYTGKSGKRALVYPGRSVPKTRPGVLGSGPGSRSGPTMVRPYVQHPGTKARRFDELIERNWRSRFRRDMEAAMRRAAAKSGHGGGL